MQFVVKPFHALTAQELFEIYKLRTAVFVVEQNCAYQDPDDKDLQAAHLFMLDNDQLAGYARLLPPGLSYKDCSIGRVVIAPAYRKSGHGRQLMVESIRQIKALFNSGLITISAQHYLLDFYTSLGFSADGDPYPEDGIPHIKMHYESNS